MIRGGRMLVCVVALIVARPSSVVVAVEVTSWDLRTGVQDFSGQTSVSDLRRINVVSNPPITTSVASVGLNSATTDYDYSWLLDMAFGDFNTSFVHAIRSVKIRTVSTGQIFIIPGEDIRVTVNGSLNYWHTPGDEGAINYFATVRDMSTNADVFNEHRQGGNLYLLPSSGTLTIQAEAELSAGIPYRLRYGLQTDNTGDLPPTGIADASGFVNFHIEPLIPEPATLALLLPAMLLIRRPRRSIRPCRR